MGKSKSHSHLMDEARARAGHRYLQASSTRPPPKSTGAPVAHAVWACLSERQAGTTRLDSKPVKLFYFLFFTFSVNNSDPGVTSFRDHYTVKEKEGKIPLMDPRVSKAK